MHLTKRFLMLALAAVAASFIAVPASASAATTLACELNGLTGSITPHVNAPLESGLGGEGDYTFSTVGSTSPVPTVCSYNGGAPTPSTITSNGHFVNTICGTGTAISDPALGHSTTINVGGGPVEVVSAKYRIDFRGGQGTLDVQLVNGQTEVAAANGHIAIHPTQGNCVNEDVTQFQVEGVFGGAIL